MSTHPYRLKHTNSDVETDPPPGRWHQLPRELWSLIVAQLDRRSLRSASLICRVAHQEADPYLYKQIVWKSWRNRHVLAVHRALQASKLRANRVRRFVIRNVEGHVDAGAAYALVEILQKAPNLKFLQLNIFTRTTMENILQFEPLLEQLAAGCPFRLHTLLTDAPFERRTVEFLTQQPDLTRLEWDTARVGRPAPTVPRSALARLQHLRSAVGWRPFASLRSITHLCIDLPPQAQLDELLVAFSDRLVSLKLVEQRRSAQPVLFRPAVAFRRGLPRTLRWLEVREIPNRGDDGDPEFDANPAGTDAFPFAEDGLALRVFVWQASWMFPVTRESCLEILRFAQFLGDARVAMRFFVFFGTVEGDTDGAKAWDLREQRLAESFKKLPEDSWRALV
ncbi:hypothetical protein FOMPIDRAFT_116690 [Fomitopsis schrenkii]|uniref:F-box domain-containing protein n=1 Tax=Fomitopsis schrenkii TaxID=2126942 RepID=S8EVN0_FOMSC|nr:hypothetical protein FOMPIDRAFT_116690 [Fomitopsis schrenkii]